MNATTTRRFSPAGLFRVAGLVLALLMVCGLVLQRSESAFMATTDTSNNTVASGGVSLTNNNSSGAFSVALDGLLKPGSTAEECIEVTYGGTMTSGLTAVAVYGGYADSTDANATADSALAQYLTTTVEVGASCADMTGATQIYTGTLKNLTDTKGTYATALSSAWTPSATTEKRGFRIRMTLQDDNAAQNKLAEPTFTWEIRTA